MAHALDIESCELEHAALKFGAGTPNVSGPVGLAAAMDFMNSLGREAIRAHEAGITAYALMRLKKPRASEATDRVPVIWPHCRYSNVLAYQRRPALLANLYTGKSDIDRLIDGLSKIVRG